MATEDITEPVERRKEKEPSKLWIWNGIFVAFTHVMAVLSFFIVPPRWQTMLMSFILFQAAAFGITMGYHRLWSHRSFKATFPLRLVLAVLGTLGFQGSIKWWVQRHRLHHRFTDTSDDPYNALEGFWFSHILWIFKKPYYPKMKSIDFSDLNSDPIVVFQHKYYVPLALFSGFIFPTMVAGLWGDSLGGFFYGGYVSRLLIWHSTFAINSFAHWIGSQDYSTEVSARGNLFLALLTVGEGHHNFHHEFPKDYRNGIKWYHYDPTKWGIQLAYWLKQAYDLHKTSSEDIRKTYLTVAEEKIREEKARYFWEKENLPSITVSEVKQRAQNGESLVILDGYVLDIQKFMSEHPGGKKLLSANIGNDITSHFYGSLNNHTLSARLKSKALRVANLVK